MINSLHLEKFTVFEKADFEFSGGLNVIIGENATGKTHVLKAAYSTLRVLFDTGMSNDPRAETRGSPLLSKLRGVFLADKTASLIRRGKAKEAILKFTLGIKTFTASIGPAEIEIHDKGLPTVAKSPVFIPPKEVLSFVPGFVSLYKHREISIDETFHDLCQALELPQLREAAAQAILPIINDLETAIGGQILFENGMVFLVPASGKKMEINLVAEGWRKLGMLAYLLRNGSIGPESTLFWDEPEANLNPRLMVLLAKAVSTLAGHGIQVFLATHSLFFLRELVMAQKTGDEGGPKPRFFALGRHRDRVYVTQGDSIEEVEPLVLLDEDLEQTQRYLD